VLRVVRAIATKGHSHRHEHRGDSADTQTSE